MSNVVPLKYVARAGLLPELTRQTYDSLYKALREVILNSVDAGATEVVVDLSRVESDGVLEISDDGSGMTIAELQQSFMSLGGSQKFGAHDKFGRIGIGSLALMHYAQRVEVETKQTNSLWVTKAAIAHPWALDQSQRSQALADFPAGEAWEEEAPAKNSHYTTIRLHGVDDLLLAECSDVGAYYKLVDRLRRILPLPLPESILMTRLAETDAAVIDLLRRHIQEYAARVVLRARWGDEVLTKRVYGDGIAQDEEWNGAPRPIFKEIVIDDEPERRVTLVGYLLSQVRPAAEWSGVTARVQNVAVEERTFFDIESDPGFRKYIAGEVWLVGDVDRARLINIDRASFNRESLDYRAVARTMQAEILHFKAERVQAPQRAKVAIKRRLDQQVAAIDVTQRLASAATEALAETGYIEPGLPPSNNGRMRVKRSRGVVEDLRELGAVVAVAPPDSPRRNPYLLRVAPDGRHVVAEVRTELVEPRVSLANRDYVLRFVEARKADPPIIIKARPRELVFNLANEVFGQQIRLASLETVIALELAYLLGPAHSAESLYDRVLSLLAAT